MKWFLAPPPPEEMAAIVAAIEVAWPSPSAPKAEWRGATWRWSGRWWNTKHVAGSRRRPWS